MKQRGMSKLKLEAESLQISIYCSIIMDILITHKELSVNKMLFFTYIVKKEKLLPGSIYNGNNTQDIIYKCLSYLTGDFHEYCNSIEFILKAIHILKVKGMIDLKNSIIRIDIQNETKLSGKRIYEESSFIRKAIDASKRISDTQFMREVVSNV
ncbi:hypothetical protein [Paenibacillus sp. KN14-4R]|uniref:hypothetical protein n=1 Tax=Paenibacillus sp. KN14-4R TaxID=3445773 RepID=UPI003FA14091